MENQDSLMTYPHSIRVTSKSYYAHIRQSDNIKQSVQTHLTETAAIARALAAKLDLPEAGELLGLMHDFGKYSGDFQEYIRAVTNQDPDADNDYVLPNGQKIDHSTAEAQWVYRRLNQLLDWQPLISWKPFVAV